MSKSVREIQQEVHALAVEKGWWPAEGCLNPQRLGERRHSSPRWFAAETAAKIALVHCELSEAVECLRGMEIYDASPAGGKPEGLVVELADAVIRIMDLCGALGVDLEEAVLRKHEYNKGRQHRHGGKVL